MKYIIFLAISFVLVSCNSNKSAFWCGDHACVNKKEKKFFFKKNMIVEKIVTPKKKTAKNLSSLEKIKKKADIDQDVVVNDSENKYKKLILSDKELAKKVRADKKKIKKEQKLLLKQLKKEEKMRLKEEKIIAKKNRDEKKSQIKERKSKKNNKKVSLLKNDDSKKINVSFDPLFGKVDISSTKFEDLIQKIFVRNKSRPYPDINNTPN